MLHEILWPEKYLPGKTDNFCSNEVIVKGLTIKDVWANLINPFLWPKYYNNASDIEFINTNSDSDLHEGTHFRFKTFGFPIEAKITEFVAPLNGAPARISWHGWAEGDAQTRLDVIHAWLIEELSDKRIRILTQESQIGEPAKKLAITKPNPMINGHQDWLEGLVNFTRENKSI